MQNYPHAKINAKLPSVFTTGALIALILLTRASMYGGLYQHTRVVLYIYNTPM